jgi:hypothetical protein
VLQRQRGSAWGKYGHTFEADLTKQMQCWITKMLTPPAAPENPHNPAKALDNAISQILALCAYCGFAKRQGATTNAEKQD